MAASKLQRSVRVGSEGCARSAWAPAESGELDGAGRRLTFTFPLQGHARLCSFSDRGCPCAVVSFAVPRVSAARKNARPGDPREVPEAGSSRRCGQAKVALWLPFQTSSIPASSRSRASSSISVGFAGANAWCDCSAKLDQCRASASRSVEVMVGSSKRVQVPST